MSKSRAELLAEAKAKSSKSLPPVRRQKWICQLRAIREKLGLTQRDVAAAVGMSAAGYHQLENGTDPQLSTATEVANFFDVEIRELWQPREA